MAISDKDQTLESIVNILKNEFSIKKAYLFGSRERGTNNQNSDYDLVVVVEDSAQTPSERFDKAQYALYPLKVSADVFVYTQTEFNEHLIQADSTIVNAAVAGRELDLG